ncbi:hypothetical protein DWF00_08325 [Bosea caraganae]|uniref:Integrase catalytic domain-containing protein n=1 Tax=Bosea caraganae TaxID=2763117 RepID=A0A370LAY2_9HYPH|nr:hypothetical protein DWF00_08325 [Bosea caraganae]RDJ29028.1 hypothetical protein DWE98_00100 [Bosea caraganae]
MAHLGRTSVRRFWPFPDIWSVRFRAVQFSDVPRSRLWPLADVGKVRSGGRATSDRRFWASLQDGFDLDAERSTAAKLPVRRRYYNEDRPHDAIGHKPPISLQNPGGRTQPAAVIKAGKLHSPAVQEMGPDQ